jgi:hypothetical protein
VQALQTRLSASLRSLRDPPHDFCISCFWYVTDKEHLARRERFAEMGGERVF